MLPILDTLFVVLLGLFVATFAPVLPIGFDIAVVAAAAAAPVGFNVDTFAAVVGNGETFLFGGDQRLKILLLVDGESRLWRGESDPFWRGDEICDVLDALFIVRRMNVADAFFCSGISMLVLLLVTFRVACNDVARLNGILETEVFVFFGDVGSDTMTGISPPADGSSLMNVP